MWMCCECVSEYEYGSHTLVVWRYGVDENPFYIWATLNPFDSNKLSYSLFPIPIPPSLYHEYTLYYTSHAQHSIGQIYTNILDTCENGHCTFGLHFSYTLSILSSYFHLRLRSSHPLSLTCWNPYNDSWGHATKQYQLNIVQLHFIYFYSYNDLRWLHGIRKTGHWNYNETRVIYYTLALQHPAYDPPPSPKAFQQNHIRSSFVASLLAGVPVHFSTKFNANALNTNTHTLDRLEHIQMRAEHSFCVYKRLN